MKDGMDNSVAPTGGIERFSVGRVAIDRPDGPVVDALLAAGIEVVVITPRQVKNLQSRYGAAGNKDDRFDAFVLADTLRTDPGRLRPLQPDTAQTIVLRQTVRARGDLVETRVALTNQLRAHFKLVLPDSVGLFADLDSPISLAFLTRFPTVEKGAQDGLTGNAGDTAGRTTLALVEAIKGICQQIRVLEPEIGDARGRYPTPEALASLAGACPSTRASGRHHVVSFRWACDKKRRDAVMDLAGDSRRASPWGAAIYDRHRAHDKTHQHTVRILARA